MRNLPNSESEKGSNLPERQDLRSPEIYREPGYYPVYQAAEEEIHLLDYWRLLVKRKWLIFAVLTSVLAGVAIETFTTTPIYRSTAKVRIDPEASNVLPYKDVLEASESYLATEAYLQTQYRILESRTLARRVIEKLKLAKDPVFNETTSEGLVVEAGGLLRSLLGSVFLPFSSGKPDAAEDPDAELVDHFLEDLETNPIRQSRLVEVSYNFHNPDLAARVLNTLTDEFIEQNFENKYEATVRATDFLQRQLQDLKIKVERSEEALTRYAREHGILNVDERENIVLQKLADLNSEMTKVQAELIGKTARYQALEDATPENFPQSLKNALIMELEKRAFELGQKLASLSARFGSEWPEVKETAQEIAEVREQLRTEKVRMIEQARIDYQVARNHYDMLSKALEEQKQLANQLNEDSIQYNILKREVETNKQLYEGLLQRLKEAGVSAGLKSSNIQIVDRGEVPFKPYRPRKALNLGLGLVVGLMLGVGLAFFVEYMDNTVKTPDQVEQFLTIPSLGVIPTMRESLQPADYADQGADRPMVPFVPDSRMWEAYRALRTSILLSSSGGQPKTLLVTSSLTGEGKTTTASNVGIVFAQTGARTLLMDLDMRKPMLARRFGVGNGGGMSTFLSGNSELASNIYQTSVPNLYVLPSGPVPPNPAELVGSDRMGETLELLRKYFKYIVIDSPPVLSVTDPVVLARRVDGVILVIEGGKTARDAIQRASDQLRTVGAKILGAIINNVDIESSEYYYYYRYYYDYGYHGTHGSGTK